MHAHRIRTDVLIKSDIYAKATVQLKKSSKDLNHMMQNFGRSTEGAWRAEQKLATLAAWLTLC